MTFAKSHISALSVVSLLSGPFLADVCRPAHAAAQTASGAQTASATTPAAPPAGACASVTADAIIPADRLAAVMEDAQSLVKQRKGAPALACYERALASAEAHGLAAERAEATLGVGAAQRVSGRYAEAQALHERALALFRELGDEKGEARAQRNLGLDFYYQAQYAKARAVFREAITLFERAGDFEQLALTYGNAMYAYDPGPEKDALREEALALARDRSRTTSPTNECSILHQWGDDFFDLGRWGDAYTRLTEALNCYKPTDDITATSTVLVSLGRLHRAHGRPDLAMPYYTRALELAERGGDELGAVQTLNAMAVGYSALQKFDLSLATYNQALARAERAGSRQTVAFIRGQIGAVYLGGGDAARALPLLEESLRLDPRHTVYRRGQAATALALLGRHEEALTHANTAVEDARKVGADQLIFALRHRENVHFYAGRLDEAQADVTEALRLIEEVRGQTVATDFMKRGFGTAHQDLFGVSIELALRRGDPIRALEIGEQARARAFLDLLATRSGAQAARASGSAATTMAAANPGAGSTSPANSGAGKSGAGGAAGSTSSNKSNSAGPSTAGSSRTASGDSTAAATSGRTGTGPANDRTRRAETTLARRGTGATADASRGAAAEAVELAHEIAERDEATQLYVDRTAAPPTIAEVRATARRLDSTLLIYWVGVDKLRIWVVSPSGTVDNAFVDIPRTEIQRLVAAASDTIDGASAGLGASASLHRPWRDLYQRLIAPVERLLPAKRDSLLTIVPHGPLFQLSFAALQDTRGRYLLERYRLHYTPAVGVLAFTGARDQSAAHIASTADALPTALLVGDPDPLRADPGEEPMARLPFAGREVEEISKLVAPWRSDILTKQDASESAVRARVEQADLLHFATHGVVQQEGTVSSYLALSSVTPTPAASSVSATAIGGTSSRSAPSSTTSALPRDDDGRLTADEVYGLDLKARLVVLSACRTALGPLSGDGVIGFTRAFLYAGASSVVATSWDVPDEAGYEVMRRFYRARAADQQAPAAGVKGRPAASIASTHPADALRNAQLGVLASLRKGTLTATTPGGKVALREHPLLWAGYLVVGEP